LIPSAVQAQTNRLTALLQQGLFEEQANRNLDAAIADYSSLAKQFDKDRQLAVTAVFRIGECYRMQGKTNEAAAQYQRILRDFSDQTTLATLSSRI
jgi:TolA-binding protein